jgi:hypothetical protein
MLKFLLPLLLLSIVFAEDITTVVYPEQKFAGELTVVKSAPQSVNLTDEFTVTITVTNKGSESVSAVVQEFLGNVMPVEPQPAYTNVENESDLVAQPPLLSWNISIAPAESKTISYTIKPKTVGPLYLSSTEVHVTGGKFVSNPLTVIVECSSSPGCDEKIGETPLSCPDKCGGDPNATAPDAPALKPIPTPSVPFNALDLPRQKEDVPMWLIAIIIVIVLAAMFFVFLKKKKQ